MAEVIVALDLPGQEALRLLDRLPSVRWVKVGSILFAREGPQLVKTLAGRGLKVFLDLKWHDIPHTVAGAIQAARDLGVSVATVHTLGGPNMLEAAQQAAGPDMGLLGVTVLTSHTAEEFALTLGRGPLRAEDEVTRLARLAVAAGLRGVVCSALELPALRARLGDGPWMVVPGIRRGKDKSGDQARVADPATAVRNGATHLVVGRPILEAADPGQVFQEIAEQARLGSGVLP
jgi:orotidine-5'-phosphate decarboxylase